MTTLSLCPWTTPMLEAPPLTCSCGRSQPRGVQMQLHRVVQHWCTSKASPACLALGRLRLSLLLSSGPPSPASYRCTTCYLGWLQFRKFTQAKASLLSVPTTAAKDGATQSQALPPVCASHVVAVGCWCAFKASLCVLNTSPASCQCMQGCCFWVAGMPSRQDLSAVL